MTSKNQKRIFTLLAAILLAYTPVTVTTSAHAYDDDVDIVCDTMADGEDYCVTVDQLKAECPIIDPDNELEICAGLNEKRVSPGVKAFKASSGKKTTSLKAVTNRNASKTFKKQK